MEDEINSPPNMKEELLNFFFILSIILVIILGFCSVVYPYYLMQHYVKILTLILPTPESQIQLYFRLFLTENLFLGWWLLSIVFFMILLILKLKYYSIK